MLYESSFKFIEFWSIVEETGASCHSKYQSLFWHFTLFDI